MQPNSRTFSNCKTKTLYPLNTSYSMNLTTLNTSHRWIPTICLPLILFLKSNWNLIRKKPSVSSISYRLTIYLASTLCWFHKRGNWGSTRWSILPKATRLKQRGHWIQLPLTSIATVFSTHLAGLKYLHFSEDFNHLHSWGKSVFCFYIWFWMLHVFLLFL